MSVIVKVLVFVSRVMAIWFLSRPSPLAALRLVMSKSVGIVSFIALFGGRGFVVLMLKLKLVMTLIEGLLAVIVTCEADAFREFLTCSWIFFVESDWSIKLPVELFVDTLKPPWAVVVGGPRTLSTVIESAVPAATSASNLLLVKSTVRVSCDEPCSNMQNKSVPERLKPLTALHLTYAGFEDAEMYGSNCEPVAYGFHFGNVNYNFPFLGATCCTVKLSVNVEY